MEGESTTIEFVPLDNDPDSDIRVSVKRPPDETDAEGRETDNDYNDENASKMLDSLFRKKQKYYRQSFKKEWMNLPEFRGWLKPNPRDRYR